MRDLTMTAVYGEATRENWARGAVTAAGKDWRTHLVKFDGTVLPRQGPLLPVTRIYAAPADYPENYRKCKICGALLGAACRSRSGRIVNGRPDGIATELPTPHIARKRRAPRKKKQAAPRPCQCYMPAIHGHTCDE